MSHTHRPALEQDARNRALRTFLVGLGIDLLVAISMLAVTLTSDTTQWQGWAVVGASLLRTVVQTAGSYVLRRFADPSSFPTPLPPHVQPDPSTTTPEP